MSTPKKNKPLNVENIVQDHQLNDLTARLFRKVFGIVTGSTKTTKTAIWKTYLDDYLREVHPDEPDNMDIVKRNRSTTIGNIFDTLFMSTSLSFGKMMTGLRILKVKNVTVVFKIEFTNGKKIEIEESQEVCKK